MSVAVGIQVGEEAPRTWLVTEVGSGLGLAISEQLLAFGERVVGTVGHLESAADLAERHPGMFYAEALDVADVAATRHVVDRTFARFGRVDVVVSTVESIGLIHAVLPRLRTQGTGRVVQLSYQGGVEGFAESVIEDVTPFRVGVTIVEPGTGDPFLVAEAIIESVDEEPPPLRLALG